LFFVVKHCRPLTVNDAVENVAVIVPTSKL